MYRTKGNMFFIKKEYNVAIKYYNMGLTNNEINKNELLLNRSTCYYNLNKFKLSLNDCVTVCKTFNKCYKGWFRLYLTLKKMNKYKEANIAYNRYTELK